MKRDLPEEVVGEKAEVPRGLLASRAFWIGGVLSVGVWALLYFGVALTR